MRINEKYKDTLVRDLSIVTFTNSGTVKSKEYFAYGMDRVERITVGTTTPLAKIQPDEATYLLYDHLGNTRVAFQVNGNNVPLIVNAINYYSYGKILREFDNGVGDRYLSTQHERDKETGLDYRGARYYDSDVARFLSLDPLAAKYPSLSPYNYVAGNPIMLIDPDGREIRNGKGEDISTPKYERETKWTENHTRLNETFGDPSGFNSTIVNSPSWASQKGFYIHQIANAVAVNTSPHFGNDDERRSYVLKLLNEGTEYADSKQFQDAKSAFRHAMRNGDQTIEEAMTLAENFVRDKYVLALEYFEKKDYKNAYFNLAVALHALQDATSPAHSGFKQWTGTESNLEKQAHVAQELVYPGTNSNLQATTNWFLEMFWAKQELPKGSIFKTIRSD